MAAGRGGGGEAQRHSGAEAKEGRNTLPEGGAHLPHPRHGQRADSLTHPPTHSLTHSLTHSPTHSLTHPLTRLPTRSLAAWPHLYYKGGATGRAGLDWTGLDWTELTHSLTHSPLGLACITQAALRRQKAVAAEEEAEVKHARVVEDGMLVLHARLQRKHEAMKQEQIRLAAEEKQIKFVQAAQAA
eukprot:9473305-Pyramimonas_sp.AAC.1